MKPDASLRHGSVFIARSRALPYSEGGMRRLLSTLLVALALILSSLTMTSGAMANTIHAAHDAAAASSAHCGGYEMPAWRQTAPACQLRGRLCRRARAVPRN